MVAGLYGTMLAMAGRPEETIDLLQDMFENNLAQDLAMAV